MQIVCRRMHTPKSFLVSSERASATRSVIFANAVYSVKCTGCRRKQLYCLWASCCICTLKLFAYMLVMWPYITWLKCSRLHFTGVQAVQAVYAACQLLMLMCECEIRQCSCEENTASFCYVRSFCVSCVAYGTFFLFIRFIYFCHCWSFLLCILYSSHCLRLLFILSLVHCVLL